MKALLAVAATGLLMASASAQAATIDFDEFTHSGQFTFHNPFTSGGFSFVNSGSGEGALGVWGSGLQSYKMDADGAAIFHNFGSSITTVTKVGGGTFDFNAIDLGDVYNGGVGGNVVFTFTSGSGTSTQTVALDNLGGGQTFTFNQTGLTAFTVQGTTTRGGWLQFDNVVVNGLGGVVPEPSTWALLILGFGLVGGAMRRSTATRLSVGYA